MDNLDTISKHDFNTFILQRIHSKIWSAAHKMNKHFAWQILIVLSLPFLIVLHHGLVTAAKLADGSAQWKSIPLASTPIHLIFILCHACHRCSDISEELKNSLTHIQLFRKTFLSQFFSMQINLQPVEFQPRNFFTFKFEFFADVVQFIIDYDIVFMQFYFT